MILKIKNKVWLRFEIYPIYPIFKLGIGIANQQNVDSEEQKIFIKKK